VSHRIVLRETVIDVPSADFDAMRDFWAAALLAQPRVLDRYPEFTELHGAASVPDIGLQDIGTGAPRVHLDIETDDVDAEVARLTALGAAEVARPHSWVILRDPGGLLFCVVLAGSPDFAERSRVVE
jgi:hypothetical protein